MKVLVSGSSGLVGSELVETLRRSGREVVRLVRPATSSPVQEPHVTWQAGVDSTSGVDRRALEERGPFDAVVHLAGESIASGRWTEEKKRRIRESRVRGTRALAEALVALDSPPRVVLSASAIGFYGDRGGEVLTESSPPGSGFLPDVCKEWEAATAPLGGGTRVVYLRTGIVLSKKGGALKKMLTPFRLGLGGRIGSGEQYMSWITLDDEIGAIEHVLATDGLRGPVNLVAPNPVTNAEFTKALGRALGRPAFLPLPAFAARLVLGEMADDLLLASARVEPQVLEATGYVFRHPTIDAGLRAALA